MTRLTVKAVNAQLKRQGLQNLKAEIPVIGRSGIFRTLQRVKKRFNYPPPAPLPTYKRTNLLKRSWLIIKLDKGYRIENTAPYSAHVIGNAYGFGQAWMHVGRWQVFRDVMDEEIERLPQEVQDHLSMVTRREGLA